MLDIPTQINICFYGLNRSLTRTYPSINANLFAPLHKLGIVTNLYSTFIRVEGSINNPRSREAGVYADTSESRLLSNAIITYLDQQTIDSFVDWDLVFANGDLYGDAHTDAQQKLIGSTYNIVRALWCLYCSYQLIPDDKKDYPVVFIRPDLEIINPLRIESILASLHPSNRSRGLAAPNSGVAVVPSWQSWYGVNDRFAVCTPGKAAEAYASRAKQLTNYLKISSHALHSESFLLHVLLMNRVQIVPIIDTPMARIRASGEVESESYLLGSQSGQFQSQAWHSLVELNQELASSLHRETELKTQVASMEKELCELKQVTDSSIEEVCINAKEEVALTLAQLNQVQGSLQRYFLRSRHLEDQLDQQTSEFNQTVHGLNERVRDLTKQRDSLFRNHNAHSILLHRLLRLIALLINARLPPQGSRVLSK